MRRLANHKQASYIKLLDLRLDGVEEQFYWNPCYCNEYDALLRRHFVKPLVSEMSAAPLHKELKKMSLQFQSFKRVSHEVLMQHTRSSIKKRYQRAWRNLYSRSTELDQKLESLKAFVKYEKIPIGKFDAGKAPRLIQYRSFEFLYFLKRELLGFDIQLKSEDFKGVWGDNQPIRTILTKLQDNYGVAQVLRDSWDMFVDPVAICNDYKSYDGHLIKPLLSAEQGFWKSLNSSKFLEKLLKCILNPVGYTMGGMKYSSEYGARASGEYTTSNGNSIINVGLLILWIRESKISRYRIHVNGDDSVIIMERSDSNRLLPLSWFRQYNQEVECDRITDVFQRISYCQASPIRVGGDRWYMVKEPIRAMSRISFCGNEHKHHLERYRLGLGICELAISSGIPMAQSLAIYLMASSRTNRPLGSIDKYPARKSGNLSKPTDILMNTRMDFELAFGISIETQLWFEKEMAGKLRILPRDPKNLQQLIFKYSKFHYN